MNQHQAEDVIVLTKIPKNVLELLSVAKGGIVFGKLVELPREFDKYSLFLERNPFVMIGFNRVRVELRVLFLSVSFRVHVDVMT